MKDRMIKLVLAHIKGEHPTAIKAAASTDDGESSDLARYLLGERGISLSLEATAAIKAAVKETGRYISPFRSFDPAAILRLGDVANWPTVAWEYGYREASVAQALYVLLCDDRVVKDLAAGEVPHCPMRGNWGFAEAAIALASQCTPPWDRLQGNQRALIAFARWRSGLEVGNGSTFSFMQAILRKEDILDDVLLALVALEPNNWAWELGQREITIPSFLPPFAVEREAESRCYARVKRVAPDVTEAVHNGRIRLDEAMVFYKKYHGQKEVIAWLEDHVDDKKIDNPSDPFGPKVSAWGLLKKEEERR